MIGRGHGSLVIALASVGTPVHELGHAFCALAFRHKLLKVELFNPKPNGQLGLVEHSYKVGSFYQTMGCFFIGVAPIFSGLIACWVITMVLIPEFDINGQIGSVSYIIERQGLFGAVDWFYRNTYASHLKLFELDWQRYLLWAFLLTSIVKHMLPSAPDMQGVKRGLLQSIVLFICLFLLFTEQAIEFIDSSLLYLLSLLVVFVAYVLACQLAILLISSLIIKWKTRNV